MMESWRKAWRDGIAPNLSTAGLEALRDALLKDDPRLIQGQTTSPPPLSFVQDWPVEAACVIGFCGWQGDGLESVAEVGERFAEVCFNADMLLGEPADCRYFLNFWDETPREELRKLMIEEVILSLEARHVNQLR